MSNKLEFPISFGLQKTGLPLIITSGKLKNLCFLIDTGATHNVLFTYVFEHFKNEFKMLDVIAADQMYHSYHFEMYRL